MDKRDPIAIKSLALIKGGAVIEQNNKIIEMVRYNITKLISNNNNGSV